MNEKKIKLLIHNSTDKQLLSDCLMNLGYDVNESFSDEWSSFSMIITDEFYARQFGRNLLLVKHHPSVIFFPIIIMLPTSADSSIWIDSGYDDVLRYPMRKAELAAKLKIFLRLREQFEYKYKFMFEHIKVGIYWMNEKNRIMTMNAAFLSILDCQVPEQVMNKNLMELGVSFQGGRDYFSKKLFDTGYITGYESYWQLKDGKKIYIRESATLLTDNDNNNYYIGTIEHIIPYKNIDTNKNSISFGDEKNA